jgi:eukaryotic-like serine/threonine-protein kinase
MDVIAILRDGHRQMVLIHDADGVRRLALRELGKLHARILPDTEEASSPFFSPDGEQIAFFGRGKLWRMPVGGGPPSPVADVPGGDNRGATWADDGYIYAAPDTHLPLQRVPERGGAFEDVTTLDPARRERTHRWPEALPGGAVLFTCDTMESIEYYDDARIEAVRPATGERKVLVEQSSRAQYVASGHLVFARGGALLAVPFDADRLEVRGRPAVVLQGVATTVASGAAHYALSPTGTLVYVPGETSTGVRPPVWIDRASGEQQPSAIEVPPTELELSPDGRRAALLLSEAGNLDLWVADLERGTLTRLTFTGTVRSPVWSPDGRWIAFTERDGIYRQRTDGGGAPEFLLKVDPALVDRTLPTMEITTTVRLTRVMEMTEPTITRRQSRFNGRSAARNDRGCRPRSHRRDRGRPRTRGEGRHVPEGRSRSGSPLRPSRSSR